MFVRETIHVSSLDAERLCFLWQVWRVKAIFDVNTGDWDIDISEESAVALRKAGVQIVV